MEYFFLCLSILTNIVLIIFHIHLKIQIEAMRDLFVKDAYFRLVTRSYKELSDLI